MAENTKIEWCDATWNPWIGCTNVSPGCDHCYAEAWGQRFGVEWGNHPRRRTSESNWRQPLKWNRTARRSGKPLRVFCASLADVFDNQVPIEWLADLLVLIYYTESLTWLLLTKRPQNIVKRLRAAVPALREKHENLVADRIERWLAGDPPPNVAIGITAEDQTRADERIPLLLATPAVVRFLSCEPLLSDIDLTNIRPNDLRGPALRLDALAGRDYHEDDDGQWTAANGRVNWVIVGGESGPHARPMEVRWVHDIVSQCQAASVPVFVKQLGSKPVVGGQRYTHPYAGTQIDWPSTGKGSDTGEWPYSIRVREFPVEHSEFPA